MNTKQLQLGLDLPLDDIEVLQAATAEDVASRARARAVLVNHPELVLRIGKLAANAEEAILDSAYRGDVLHEETARAELELLRVSLARPSDDALERLLIERISLCWLALNIAELRRGQRGQSSLELETRDFWDRHISRLNADFLKACKTLATVRRLRVPAVQMNFAHQQINVA